MKMKLNEVEGGGASGFESEVDSHRIVDCMQVQQVEEVGSLVERTCSKRERRNLEELVQM